MGGSGDKRKREAKEVGEGSTPPEAAAGTSGGDGDDSASPITPRPSLSRRARGGAGAPSRRRRRKKAKDPEVIGPERVVQANMAVRASVGGNVTSFVPEATGVQQQPLFTCLSCRRGPGTVAPPHLCRCPQCPGSPVAVHDQCPFCALLAVPEIRNWLEGMCPCCGYRQGIASPDHICMCYVCRQVPDEVCPHCPLAAVPQPRQRPDGACPCCLTNAGTVSTYHLCLCLRCKALPEAKCPFCELAAGRRVVPKPAHQLK